MRFNRATSALVLWLSLRLAGATAWALDPNQPPGTNFDLSHWKLQLPTLNGVLTGTSGSSVDEKSPALLTAGFTNAYFYTGSDGSMVFWAPDNGASTSGSTHPRSELREEIIPGNDGTNWILYGTHILNGQCKVWQIPSDTKKVIIGQIHAVNSVSNLPTVKIQYNNGTLEGTFKAISTNDASDTKFTFGTAALSNSITYQIKVVNGLITIAMNNKTNSLNVFQTDTTYTNVQQYFKAGSYNQTDDPCNCSTDGARVAFYVLNWSHAPSITNQPASQTVLVGSNVTFTVGALGNPPLYYAWRLNGTNINNATNATLVIPNVQLTNAGAYSVVVTDSVGTVISTVTSSNAVLTVNALAPLANFTATPTNGVAPLNVAFADTSSNSPTNWAWSFGDAGTSALQSPSHTYTTAGVYTVRLIASNTGGSSTNTKPAFINAITVLQSWLNYYGVPADGSDPFGVGVSNTNKFLAGFSPTNAAAYAQIISVVVSGTDINITYLGANGDASYPGGPLSRTNVLEYSVGDADGGYTSNFVTTGLSQVLSNGIGSGVITNMVDPGGATNGPSRYYHIRVLAP